MTRWQRILRWAGVALVVAGTVAVIAGIAGLAEPTGRGAEAPVPTATSTPESIVPTGTPTATSTPEPIVPTRTPTPIGAPILPSTVLPPSATPREGTVTPTAEAMGEPSVTPAAASTPAQLPATPTARPAVTATPSPQASLTATILPTVIAGPGTDDLVVPASEHFRLGVSLPYGAGRDYDLATLKVGWVMDWGARATTALPGSVAYAQTVRMSGGALRPEAAVVTNVARARPGSLWLISNEPDVRWQDNVTPDVYARLYHDAYEAIKQGDPSAIVAAGGIAQPTELRLRYLDLALQSYQSQFGSSLPAQAWHIHNYMLREERDSWGVDIPPGLPDNVGVQYSVEDSGNLDAFRAQIYAFRRWMASRGYGGQPLIVSEFGIPMPADYGFPPDDVAAFLRETWRFFLTAADASLGDPSDGGRLVQRWCWFSLGWPDYPTGDLVDMETGQWTTLGQAWIALARD